MLNGDAHQLEVEELRITVVSFQRLEQAHHTKEARSLHVAYALTNTLRPSYGSASRGSARSRLHVRFMLSGSGLCGGAAALALALRGGLASL